MCKILLKEKRQNFTFSAQVDCFKIKLHKLDLLKFRFCFGIDCIGNYQMGWLAGMIFTFSNLNVVYVKTLLRGFLPNRAFVRITG